MKAFKGVVITTYQEEITVMANTKEEAELLMSWFDMIALKHFQDQIKQILSQKTIPVSAELFLE
jgi:hypothetical protein